LPRNRRNFLTGRSSCRTKRSGRSVRSGTTLSKRNAFESSGSSQKILFHGRGRRLMESRCIEVRHSWWHLGVNVNIGIAALVGSLMNFQNGFKISLTKSCHISASICLPQIHAMLTFTMTAPKASAGTLITNQSSNLRCKIVSLSACPWARLENFKFSSSGRMAVKSKRYRLVTGT